MKLARLFRTLRHVRPEQVAWRLWFRAKRPFLRTDFYRRSLGARPIAPKAFPPALWPGDSENGHRLLAGSIRLLNEEMEFGRHPDWSHPGHSPLWRFTFNYFEWLADLKAVGTPQSLDRARDLVTDWWDIHHDQMAAEPWHPYPTSLRLFAWLAHGQWLLDGAPDEFRNLFACALDRHARHLARMVERDVAGNHIIKNLKALAIAGVCLPGHDFRLAPALAELRRELDRQILADGCHYERSPAYHLQVLADLVDLDAALPHSPDWLGAFIARMKPALAFFRHGDGLLALFNDGEVCEPARLAALEAVVGPATPPDDLDAAGYCRLVAGKTLVLFDCGLCCPDDLPAHAHADTLSFELSDGSERIIVNSGTYAYQDVEWRNSLRGTAAHSTVTVDGMDSAEIYGVFRIGRRPRDVRAERDGNSVTASHDGWRHLGMIHHRRLVLGADGLAGEDAVDNAKGRRLDARFHLHPSVVAEKRGDAVALRLASGTVWRFTAENGTVGIADGHYAPSFGLLQPNRHIIVIAAGDAPIRWRFERFGS